MKIKFFVKKYFSNREELETAVTSIVNDLEGAEEIAPKESYFMDNNVATLIDFDSEELQKDLAEHRYDHTNHWRHTDYVVMRNPALCGSNTDIDLVWYREGQFDNAAGYVNAECVNVTAQVNESLGDYDLYLEGWAHCSRAALRIHVMPMLRHVFTQDEIENLEVEVLETTGPEDMRWYEARTDYTIRKFKEGDVRPFLESLKELRDPYQRKFMVEQVQKLHPEYSFITEYTARWEAEQAAYKAAMERSDDELWRSLKNFQTQV